MCQKKGFFLDWNGECQGCWNIKGKDLLMRIGFVM